MKLPTPRCDDCEFVKYMDEAKSAIELNTALDRSYSELGVGLLIFGSDNKVIHCNGRAEIFLCLPGQLFGLSFDQIRLRFDQSSYNKIQRLYDSFKTGGYERQDCTATIEGLEVMIKLERMNLSLVNYNTSGFLMFISSLSVRDKITPASVGQLLGLTKAEANLTVALVNGMTATEYSLSNKVSIHTVYSQIKGILAKSGVRRQTELVKLVLERLLHGNVSLK